MASGFINPQELDATPFWIGGAVMLLPLSWFAYFLPNLKAASLEFEGLPKHTFLLTRPVLQFLGSSLVGTSMGYGALAIINGSFHVPMACLYVLSTAAFLYSSRKRFRRHPNSEFSMPPPLPYPFVRPMRKSPFKL